MIDRRSILAASLARQAARAAADLTGEWFAEQRRFFDETAQLAAAKCSRRAGKTRGIVRHMLRRARAQRGARILYLNSTRGECERLAWLGNRQDGVRSLVERLKLPAILDNADLTCTFPATDGVITMRGADDEAGVRKALGGAYHEVIWDEAQKIPPKLATTIREVLMPTLLDFGGRMRLAGTCSRQQSGLFYEVTRDDGRRIPNWSVHEWTLEQNPFFGRVEPMPGGGWAVKWSIDTVHATYATRAEAEAGVAACRWEHGVLALQRLLGGAELVPLDSPIMMREAFARWTSEDAAHVYAVHKVPRDQLVWARALRRSGGFPDIPAQLAALPWSWHEGFFALGADIGYFPDPFAFVLWGWHPSSPALWEIASWKQHNLTSDDQARVLHEVRAAVPIAITTADAGGPAKPTVAGWSAAWVDRYGLPILEADKSNKETAISAFNGDLVNGHIRLLDGGVFLDEADVLQWSTIVSGTGRRIEDPTQANHATDAGLYAHRMSYHHRHRPAAPPPPPPGSPEWLLREEAALAQAALDEREGDDDYLGGIFGGR